MRALRHPKPHEWSLVFLNVVLTIAVTVALVIDWLGYQDIRELLTNGKTTSAERAAQTTAQAVIIRRDVDALMVLLRSIDVRGNGNHVLVCDLARAINGETKAVKKDCAGE